MIDSPRVCVQVQSVYIESQSTPDEERFVFAYTVTIRNLGRMPVQLLGRYWLITNGNGREIEVGAKVWSVNNPISPTAKSISTPAARSLKRRWVPCRAIMKWSMPTAMLSALLFPYSVSPYLHLFINLMSTYLIGDVHGCYDELIALLKQVDFTPGQDTLWLTGDLVARGPGSTGRPPLCQIAG